MFVYYIWIFKPAVCHPCSECPLEPTKTWEDIVNIPNTLVKVEVNKFSKMNLVFVFMKLLDIYLFSLFLVVFVKLKICHTEHQF